MGHNLILGPNQWVILCANWEQNLMASIIIAGEQVRGNFT